MNRGASRVFKGWWQAVLGLSVLALALADPAATLGAVRAAPLGDAVSLDAPAAVVTPLQGSGLTPVWQENFPGGSIDTMQFTWTQGDLSSLTTAVQPGSIFLHRRSTTTSVEQEINHFKGSSSEPLAATLEFDVFSPVTGNGRISLRPWRRGDMIHMLLGQSNDTTTIKFRPIDDATPITYSEKTGPTRGWAHVVESYEQYMNNGAVWVHQVVAINDEVHEFRGPSGITNPDYESYWESTPDADGWSIEHQSAVSNMGKYVANVRGYQPFLTVTQLQARLTGVDAYRAGLADPRSYSGPTWAVQLNTPLDSHGPNAVAYARATGSQAAEFDASYSSSWHRITSYAWTFDDGSHASGRVVNHTFSSGGTHRATVAVTSEYGTDSRTVSVDLSGGGSTNHAPVANADGYSVAQGGSLAISSPGVLGNDTDADGDHLTATLVATASHGSLDLDANGGFTYTPNSAYTGADSFTYRANDGTANSNVATVSISVTLSGGGGGDIALHAAATGANTGGSTLVLPRPSGTVSGDVLVAATSVRGIPTITAPSGWTLVRRDAKKTNFSQAVFVHVATGAEPASYTFSFGASGAAVGTIAAYAGVDTASPIAASGGQANGSSTSVTAPSITSGVANTRLVGFFLSATKTAFSAPSGMTERAEAVSPAAATAKLTSELADQAYGPTGATGTRVAIATKAASSVGQLIALRPA